MFKFFKKSKKGNTCERCGRNLGKGESCGCGSSEKQCGCGSGKLAKDCCEA